MAFGRDLKLRYSTLWRIQLLLGYLKPKPDASILLILNYSIWTQTTLGPSFEPQKKKKKKKKREQWGVVDIALGLLFPACCLCNLGVGTKKSSTRLQMMLR